MTSQSGYRKTPSTNLIITHLYETILEYHNKNILTEKFDVLRGRLLGNHNDFHWLDSQESTTKDVKLFGYDFRGHTRGTLVVGIAYGYPYYKGSAIFSLVFFFLSTTTEKSFIS